MPGMRRFKSVLLSLTYNTAPLQRPLNKPTLPRRSRSSIDVETVDSHTFTYLYLYLPARLPSKIKNLTACRAEFRGANANGTPRKKTVLSHVT